MSIAALADGWLFWWWCVGFLNQRQVVFSRRLRCGSHVSHFYVLVLVACSHRHEQKNIQIPYLPIEQLGR